MKYRSRLGIVALTLRAVTGTDASGSRLVYSGCLSHAQLRESLPYLEERGLVRRDRDSNLCSLTASGLEALRLYDEVGGKPEGCRSLVPVAEEVSVPSWLRLGSSRTLDSYEGS